MPGNRKNGAALDSKPMNNGEEALELARSSALAHGWIKPEQTEPALWLIPALELAGLTPEEAGAVAAWHGMPTPAGVPEEFRRVKQIVDTWPEDTEIVTSALAFWQWADPGHYRGSLWTIRRAFENVTPSSVAGRGAQKLAKWVMARAAAHRPSPLEMAEVINAREEGQPGRGKRRLIIPLKPVRLYQVWSLELNIRKALGEEGSLDPETLAATLRPLVEVDCWRASQAPTTDFLTRCTLCGLVTRDSYGFCWGSFRGQSYTACPACQGEPVKTLMKRWESEPEEPRPTAGPATRTPPDKRQARVEERPDTPPIVQKRLL